MRGFERSLQTVLALLLVVAAGAARAEFMAADVYRSASPSVVVIFGFDAQGNTSSGTGSIVTAAGVILTNNHVIFDAKTNAPYSNIRVFFKPDRITGDIKTDLKDPYPVRILGRDESLDLALLQVLGPPSGLRVIPLGDSERVPVGSPVAAIGHPGGGGLWTLTTGTISSARRDGARDVFQTDAAINPGNSGGPLLDRDAHLIGVNTFVRRVNAQGLPLEGLNYSLRSGLARTWMASHGQRVPIAEPARGSSVPVQQTPAPAAPEPSAEEPEAAAPPSAAAEEPAPVVPEDETPPVRTEPKPFDGPNGERMYGVPDRKFDLQRAGREVWKTAIEHANDAFDELDAEL